MVCVVLRHWGYGNVLAVSSAKHHASLRELGASACFDYNDKEVVEKIVAHADNATRDGPPIPVILDCIGSLEGTLRPLSQIAGPGSKVAIMLPVIVKEATRDVAPEYEMDVSKLALQWREGVEAIGVRTHFYMDVSRHSSPAPTARTRN